MVLPPVAFIHPQPTGHHQWPRPQWTGKRERDLPSLIQSLTWLGELTAQDRAPSTRDNLVMNPSSLSNWLHCVSTFTGLWIVSCGICGRKTAITHWRQMPSGGTKTTVGFMSRGSTKIWMERSHPYDWWQKHAVYGMAYGPPLLSTTFGGNEPGLHQSNKTRIWP